MFNFIVFSKKEFKSKFISIFLNEKKTIRFFLKYYFFKENIIL